MIYFAQLPTGAIKIGKADDVDVRISQLEKYYRQPLSLLHVIEGDLDTEREIHERFSHLRFGRKEQFKPGADLMEFIGKPLLVSANSEAVIIPTPRMLGLTAVKIDVTLARKAKTIADDRGIPLSTYLSGAVETAVAKDWPKILKKMVEEASE